MYAGLELMLSIASAVLLCDTNGFVATHSNDVIQGTSHRPWSPNKRRFQRPVAKSVSATVSATEEVFQRVKMIHETEVANGIEMFGRGLLDKNAQDQRQWSDADFVSHSVGRGYSGPDEHKLLRGDEVFETVEPVFSEAECNELVAEARAAIAEGIASEESSEQSGRHRTNSELGEAKVSTLPKAREWLKAALREKLFPLLESRFGIAAEDLALYDSLIIGYGYFGPARSQPIHRDSSLLSLNIALSPSSDYVGGGTYFEGIENSPIGLDQGHVICHSGGAMHAGNGISSGERWVLVLFVVARSEPQLARRCHTEGVRLKSEGDLDSAEKVFEAGLAVAPRDHLLNLSLGSIYAARGDMDRAREYLEIASGLYPHCQKPLVGLGRMLLSSGQPREALRAFDKALLRIDDRDQIEGAWLPLKATAWDARVHAAQSAVVCADEEVARDSEDSKERPSALLRLPEAVQRLRVALTAAPDNGQLLGLLARAEELMSEASTSENAAAAS